MTFSTYGRNISWVGRWVRTYDIDPGRNRMYGPPDCVALFILLEFEEEFGADLVVVLEQINQSRVPEPGLQPKHDELLLGESSDRAVDDRAHGGAAQVICLVGHRVQILERERKKNNFCIFCIHGWMTQNGNNGRHCFVNLYLGNIIINKDRIYPYAEVRFLNKDRIYP